MLYTNMCTHKSIATTFAAPTTPLWNAICWPLPEAPARGGWVVGNTFCHLLTMDTLLPNWVANTGLRRGPSMYFVWMLSENCISRNCAADCFS